MSAARNSVAATVRKLGLDVPAARLVYGWRVEPASGDRLRHGWWALNDDGTYRYLGCDASDVRARANNTKRT